MLVRVVNPPARRKSGAVNGLVWTGPSALIVQDVRVMEPKEEREKREEEEDLEELWMKVKKLRVMNPVVTKQNGSDEDVSVVTETD